MACQIHPFQQSSCNQGHQWLHLTKLPESSCLSSEPLSSRSTKHNCVLFSKPLWHDTLLFLCLLVIYSVVRASTSSILVICWTAAPSGSPPDLWKEDPGYTLSPPPLVFTLFPGMPANHMVSNNIQILLNPKPTCSVQPMFQGTKLVQVSVHSRLPRHNTHTHTHTHTHFFPWDASILANGANAYPYVEPKPRSQPYSLSFPLTPTFRLLVLPSTDISAPHFLLFIMTTTQVYASDSHLDDWNNLLTPRPLSLLKRMLL